MFKPEGARSCGVEKTLKASALLLSCVWGCARLSHLACVSTAFGGGWSSSFNAACALKRTLLDCSASSGAWGCCWFACVCSPLRWEQLWVPLPLWPLCCHGATPWDRGGTWSGRSLQPQCAAQWPLCAAPWPHLPTVLQLHPCPLP